LGGPRKYDPTAKTRKTRFGLGPVVMMPPWLMRSLRPCRAAHPAVGEAKLRPGRLGAAAASTCHLCASTTDTRPGKGKPIEAQRLPMNPRRRRGIGKREHLPPRSSDRSRQTCCGALGRHTVVLVAIGIAPSRSRAPELTSDSGPAGGGLAGPNRASFFDAQAATGAGSGAIAQQASREWELRPNEGFC
jgi:hypothetical protein